MKNTTFTCTTDARFNSREWNSEDGTILVFRGALRWHRCEGDAERTFDTAREAFSGVGAAASLPYGSFDFDAYAATFAN